MSFRSIWLNVIKTNYFVHEHKGSPCISEIKKTLVLLFSLGRKTVHCSHRVNLIETEKNKVKLIMILTLISNAEHTLSSK